jgi:nucleoside-diphosphate-sugar epimerase
MRTAVVTGMAGTLGSRVADLLSAAGTRVVGVDLPGTPGAIDGDLAGIDLAGGTDAALAAVVAGADTVVHLAWRIPEGRRRRGRDHPANEANRRALERVLRVAAAAGVTQLVYVSSATVYGAWPDNPVPLSEDAPIRPNPAFTFGVGKAEAERVVGEWRQGHPGLRVAVLRPAVTLGGPEHPLYQALAAIRVPRGADGSRPVQYLHVDDLASAVALVVERRLAGVFNVAPDSGIREDTARELAGGLAKVALPARLARAVATWSWDLWRTGIPAEALPYSTNPWVVAPDRIRAEGWAPRYSSEEALVATDARPHWDDLPPGRRQNWTMAVLGGGFLTLVGGGVAGLLRWQRHRRG